MNVLMLSTTFIPSVLLCGHCQLDYLEKQGKINYKFVPSHFVTRENVKWADVIVFGRSDTDIDAYVSKIAKRAGKHLAYFLDDDILNAPSYLSCYPYYALPSTKNNIKKCMMNCDTFLTPSPVLLEKYGKYFNHKYLISEPSLNRIEQKPKNEKVKIGFAGSIDRTQDLNQILEGAITKIVKKYGNDIEIEIMGAKPDFVEKLNLKHLPYQDGYDAYTAFMARCNWDIGLAPMPDTPFHHCKYFNKYVEYASFGIAGVYSNLLPYTYGIRDKDNGLLVDNTTDAWVKAISTLIDNKRLRNKISRACLKESDEKYSLRVLAPDYFDKLINTFNKKDSYGYIPPFIFAKALFFVKRVYRKIKEQGKDFPDWLKKKLDKKYQEYKDNKQYEKNTNILKNILDNRNTVFVFSPIYSEENIKTKYGKRIKFIDDELLKDNYVIYLDGEDRGLEHLKTEFIDERHAKITFNSFDMAQAKNIIDLIKQSGVCIIHGVNRFIREKISNDMYQIFNEKEIKTIWDAHGMIPEEYHKLNNIHTEMVTNDIEKRFYDNADVLICENSKLKKHFIDKYSEKEIKVIVYPSKDGEKELKRYINSL